ncbi:unnamed protein product [Mytilus coruscus]|uniref:Uncharacterized protein n=1 Tax=Mytilus coruscus TaxID=42192 RepID=A0A6J8D5F0_MYTCO|nr:unnamed protein product [Mytilus coruscus]
MFRNCKFNTSKKSKKATVQAVSNIQSVKVEKTPALRELQILPSTLKKFDMAIGGYVYERVLDLDKRMKDIISTCNAKMKSEYKDCAMCLNKCSFHKTLTSISSSRVRRGRVSFRGPRFGRGWGKKRDVQKAVRDMKCPCIMCDTFQKMVSDTERIKRVCGSSFFSKKGKLIKERNDAFNVYKFTTNNQFVNKIFVDLRSLKRIKNEFYLTNSIIMFSTPNGSKLSVKMTQGMPWYGLTPVNTIEIARLEGPNIFALLKKNL